MPSLSTIAVFALASFALVVVPGPSVLYIVNHSIDRGPRVGIVAALGIESGTMVHAVAAALGLSALLVSSATAFTVVKVVGAAYLIYLGIREVVRRGGEAGAAPSSRERGPLKVYRQGVLVNALNPKTAVFALAFFPQFVEPGRGPVALQVLVLGLVLTFVGFMSDMGWVFLGGAAGRRLKAKVRERLQRVSGGMFIALGVGTAVSAARRVH